MDRARRRAIPRAERSPLFNQSVEKAFAVLEAFDVSRRSMNLPELAAATGISKSAAQRLAHTLEALGYLRKDGGSKRYSVAPRAVVLALRYASTSTLVEIATPYLLDLNLKCRETVNLSEPFDEEMVFVASFPGGAQLSVQLPVGGSYPMYCTAAGRAYLAGRPECEAWSILLRRELRAYTPATVTDPKELARLLDGARENGFAYARGEFFRGDINFAAPVFGADGLSIAAVGLSVPVTRWKFEDALVRIGPKITEVAQAISSRFSPKRPL